MISTFRFPPLAALAVSSVAAFALLPGFGLSALAQPELEQPSAVAPTEEAADAVAESANYSDDTMSIDFPATWEVEVVDDGVLISNVPPVDDQRVATQVVRMAAPPGPVVDANIDSFIEEGSAVGRYRKVVIDGQEALVIWLSERPDDLPAAIATFIGYGDETIFLFSRYSPTNAGAEGDILRLHTSFTNLAAGAATAEEPVN
ncbi:MAG: hypothetical protein WBC73_14570 [Phormidesmis sp.]